MERSVKATDKFTETVNGRSRKVMVSNMLGSVLSAHHACAQLHSREPLSSFSWRHLNIGNRNSTLCGAIFQAIGKASYFHPMSINRVDGISRTLYVAKARVYGRHLHSQWNIEFAL